MGVEDCTVRSLNRKAYCDLSDVLINYDEFRYHLLPYIYSISWKVANEGYSMMRALVMDFREDSRVYNIGNQYMFGPALMVAPVIKAGVATRKVYLPIGTSWIDFWTGKTYKADKRSMRPRRLRRCRCSCAQEVSFLMGHRLNIPARRMIRSSCACMPAPMENSRCMKMKAITTIYEKGAYSTIPISWNDSTRILRIGKRAGSFTGMTKEHTFRVVWVSSGHGVGVPSTSDPDVLVHYQGTP